MKCSNFTYWDLKQKGRVKYLEFNGWDNVRVYYSTRVGGVSPPPYDTLNLHAKRGDSLEDIESNREIFYRTINVDESNVVYTNQNHSAKVNVVNSKGKKIEGDGIITDKKHLFLAVFTADCIALFLYSSRVRVISLLHVGWKGAEKGIIERGVRKICKEYRVEPDGIEALLGPSIGPTCYQVGEGFRKRFGRDYVVEKEGRLYFDMWSMVEDRLKQTGISRSFSPHICTFLRNDLFFSYRKSGDKVGENIGVIGLV
jgi:YfiH family protein